MTSAAAVHEATTRSAIANGTGTPRPAQPDGLPAPPCPQRAHLSTNRIAPVGLAASDVDDDPDTTVVEDDTDAGTDEEMTEDTETEDTETDG